MLQIIDEHGLRQRSKQRKRGFSAIGLYRPRCPANLAGVLRAAGCYGSEMVVIGGELRSRINLGHTADTQRAWKHIPTLVMDDLFDAVPMGATTIGVEFIPNAKSLVRFTHPERAFYIFGPEDGSLPETVLERCQHVVQIPTQFCLNLAATVCTVLYDRLAKSER